MTVTHSSLVVLMMTIFSQVKTVKRVAKEIPMESGGCVRKKKSIFYSKKAPILLGKMWFFRPASKKYNIDEI